MDTVTIDGKQDRKTMEQHMGELGLDDIRGGDVGAGKEDDADELDLLGLMDEAQAKA